MKTIRYAKNTEHWEGWWHEYKFGAFYIFPPDHIMTVVDKLREKYDPKSAKYCRAHISLSEPLQHEITEDELHQLKADLKSIDSFEISYGPIGSHPPYPGVTYEVGPKENFDLLRKTIHSSKIFDGVEIKRSSITPHMTIAEFITLERTAEILTELKDKETGGVFSCEEIVLAVPNDKFYFEPVLSIPFG